MSETGASLSIFITLAKFGCKPLILDSRLEQNSEEVQLHLESVGSPHSMAAMMILLLLAKHHGDKPTEEDGKFYFGVPYKTESWVNTLANFFRDEARGKVWVEKHFLIKQFFYASRGATQIVYGKKVASTWYDPTLMSTAKLVFLTNLPGSDQKSQVLEPEALLPRAFAIESFYKKRWSNSAIQYLLDSGAINQSILLASPSIEEVTFPASISKSDAAIAIKSILYFVRKSTGEQDCIRCLERHIPLWPTLCNYPLTQYEDSILTLAVRHKKKALVKRLLRLREINVNHENRAKVTPLFKALAVGNDEIIDLILSKNPKTDVKTAMGTNAIYELVFGASYKAFDRIKHFVRNGIDCNNQGVDGLIPLMVAIMRDDASGVLEYLIDAADKADILDSSDLNGQSLVYKACKEGDFDTLVKLIERMLTKGQKWGSAPPPLKFVTTPLFQAIEQESARSVERILNYVKGTSKAEMCESIFARSPLHIAVLKRNLDIVKLLIEAEADPFCQDAYGRTPRELLPYWKGEREEDLDFALNAWEQQINEREYHAD